MRRVTLTYSGKMRTFAVTESETPYQILTHCDITPETSFVYLNGKLLSENTMRAAIPAVGSIFIAVQNKTV